jgi:Recombination endonuclease VII
VEKPAAEFWADRSTKTGLSPHCRRCGGGWRRERLYDLTPEQYESLYASQDGRCKICQSAKLANEDGELVVDHDHQTGKVRGLLCHHCNLILGHAKDSPDILRAAVAYLEE